MHHSDKTIEKLTKYLTTEEGTVVLTDGEEKMLEVVLMAHGLFSTGRYRTLDIRRILCNQHGISTNAAHMSMRTAQIIFGGKVVYNRRYMAAQHLDEIIADMVQARADKDDDKLIKLHAVKAKLIELLPADAPIRDITPAQIVFNIYRQQVPVSLSLQDALQRAAQFLQPRPLSETIEIEHADD